MGWNRQAFIILDIKGKNAVAIILIKNFLDFLWLPELYRSRQVTVTPLITPET